MNTGASSIDSDNLGSDSSPDCYIENTFSSKTSDLIESPYHVSMAGEKKGSPDHIILRQPRQPIHKSCLGLHKEHELTNVQDKVERKTKEVKRKVVAKSSYFQQKQVEKNACDEKQEQLSSGIFVDERKNGISGAHMLSQQWKKLSESNEMIDENWLRFYWQQILQDVNTIHEERIVHSNLKSANFLQAKEAKQTFRFAS
ncbi:hypothetical protein KIW84_044118 [Lathyrus oleraceus]|uniref:Uncharacterized protein n=1 Tax=Pisum sativum TaxID=3888 RepID=A0A9D4XHH0_PEA|nr:hypothetical protein KIW84_044118 [Pisum sativum]